MLARGGGYTHMYMSHTVPNMGERQAGDGYCCLYAIQEKATSGHKSYFCMMPSEEPSALFVRLAFLTKCPFTAAHGLLVLGVVVSK